MALFSLTVFVLFHFGLHRDSVEGSLASGVLWVTFLLATVLGVNRLFASEREGRAIDGILLAPIDRTAVYVAKASALFLYLVALEIVAVPAFAVLLLGPDIGGAFPELLAVLVLADIGLAAVGALVSGLAAETRARDLLVPLCGFVAGGLMAIQQLRTGSREWDMRSYVAVHLSLILAVGALLTGSIWAKASWGHWWEWNEPVLVSFLILFLLYCCYQPLRFSIDDPERQARYASVFAIVAGAFVPINFIAVRLARAYLHPRVLTETGGSLPGQMRLTFTVAVIAMALLFVTLWKLELATKNTADQLRRLRRV